MSKQDLTFGATSPRYQAALLITETLKCLDLDDAYGISMERATDSKGKNHWSILFCKARTVDGHIRVYSDRYITLALQQARGIERFTSARDVQRHLIETYLN